MGRKIVMNENENLVTEEEIEVTENAEQTAEETPKMYTEDEMNAKVNELLGKKIARKTAKIEKEYARKYGELEEVLKAGTGKNDVGEMTTAFRDFYRSKGIDIPDTHTHSERDVEILARADAEEIINGDFEDVVEEVDRLAAIGVANMNAREKALFKALAEHRKNIESKNELAQIGVTEDVYDSAEFKAFAAKYKSTIPVREIYDDYVKMQPKKQIRTMGSMKQGQSEAVKDYYTPEEIERLTEEDLDDPKVWEAVRRSMTGG
jgi:hypothetical protein